jgi:predicted AAA+ superfamily ATPase
VGISRETVERYLDLLEQSFIDFRLRALSRNSRKEIAKGRKVYSYDLGIRKPLLKNFNELHLRSDVGALWGHFCVIERMKHNHDSGRMVNPWFWRTYDVASLLRTLEALGYTGPVGSQGYGIKGDSREILTQTMSAWQQCSRPARGAGIGDSR